MSVIFGLRFGVKLQSVILNTQHFTLKVFCNQPSVCPHGTSSTNQVADELAFTALTTMDEDCGVLENGDCEIARQTSDITFSTNIGPSPGLRRKQLMWQNAVRNIIDQHNLYSLRLAGGLERGRHRIIVTDAYIADINR